MYVRQNGNAHDQASSDNSPDVGTVQRSHGVEQGMTDRYKLVLFNNDVLRLDSVSGAVWILEYQRDPQSHQVIKPHWVAIAPPPDDEQ